MVAQILVITAAASINQTTNPATKRNKNSRTRDKPEIKTHSN